MEGLDFFLVTTSTLGFISICRVLFHFLRWVWIMFLRPPKQLKDYGSWAIITGSTDGIGKALAFELASKGLNLILVGRNPLKLEATSKEIRDRHDGKVEVKFVVIDMQKDNEEEITKRIEEAIDGLDVGMLVNSAGLAYPYARFFHEVDSELMDAIIKVNVEGLTWITKSVLPSMIKKKKGAIINIGSGSTVVLPSYPLVTLYAATKAYLAMFSRCISVEYEHQGIDIQCQVPLFVSTKMTKMRASLFVPTPETYSKTCTRWIGYEKLVMPYFFHSLQWFLIRAIPDAFVDSYMLRYFLYWRRKGLFKDSKTKALAASNSEANLHHS
ncbi:very-long-chain 3-oxoacyl-CoA reductase 1-like [Gastrolobium bilobum]|uniref:very-long-chain 3-oxoacyl-CoA reductase 1-like n=1 Tax=Gastrolobium bilobum TaxID=150636 RepID=UPI002AB015E5|nr:very-long-chain 3-oxoacyl-CoA reductase 1-like [Gastrolobium bilobum]